MKSCPHGGDKPLNGRRYCSPCFVKELRRLWYPKPEDGPTYMEEADMAKKKAPAKKQAAKPKASGEKGPAKPKKEGHSLAAIIDPLLFEGTHTVKEIAAELGRKAGEAAKGKDLEANVRARLFTYRKKGYAVEKDAEKRVKIVQAA